VKRIASLPYIFLSLRYKTPRDFTTTLSCAAIKTHLKQTQLYSMSRVVDNEGGVSQLRSVGEALTTTSNHAPCYAAATAATARADEEDLEEELELSIQLRIAAERTIKHLEQELKDEKVRSMDLEKRLGQHQERVAKLLQTAKSSETGLLAADRDIQSLKQEKMLLETEKASLLLMLQQSSQREGSSNQEDKVVEANATMEQSKQCCTPPSPHEPRRLVKAGKESTISTNGSARISPPVPVAAGGGEGFACESDSRKRYGGGSIDNRLAQKKKAINPAPKTSIDNNENEFSRNRDDIVSQLPPSYGIGSIGVVKAGRSKKNFVVLVCSPNDVPPLSPVRQDWLKLYFRVNEKSV
jgi:hypothetical protein